MSEPSTRPAILLAEAIVRSGADDESDVFIEPHRARWLARTEPAPTTVVWDGREEAVDLLKP